MSENKIRAIGVDPGLSIGVAVLWTDCVELSTVSFREFDVRNYDQDVLWVVEQAPSRQVTPYQAHIEHDIGREIALIRWVMPGHWKPLAKALTGYHPEAATQHEKDAYALLHYHFLAYLGQDIGFLPLCEVHL